MECCKVHLKNSTVSEAKTLRLAFQKVATAAAEANASPRLNATMAAATTLMQFQLPQKPAARINPHLQVSAGVFTFCCQPTLRRERAAMGDSVAHFNLGVRFPTLSFDSKLLGTGPKYTEEFLASHISVILGSMTCHTALLTQ